MNAQNQHRRVPRSSIRIICPGSARALGLMLTVALFASMISSFVSGPLDASAAGTSPSNPSGATFQEDGAGGEGTTGDAPVEEEIPPVEETPVVEDPPVVEETPTPVVEEIPIDEETTDPDINSLQADPNTSRIIVLIRTCSEPYDDDFAQLDSNCKYINGHEFDVYGVSTAGQGMQQTGSYFLDVNNIGAGQYTIRSFTPNGYRSPSVFCSRGPSPTPPYAFTETVTYDGYYEFELAQNEVISCQWFYTPRVYGYGSLTVGYSICPPEDAIPFPFDYDNAGINELATICSLYKEQPVPMKIYSHADGFSMTQYTSTSSGTVTWTTLPAGGQTLSVDPRSGYTPRMFCYHNVGAGGIFEVRVQNWNAETEVKKNVGTGCDWFLVPDDPSAQDELPTGDNKGTVAVQAYACGNFLDSDVDPYTVGLEELHDACVTYDFTELEFTLSHEGTGTSESRMAGDAGEGAAMWQGVEGGNVTLTGSEIAGYGAPIVYCSVYNPAALVLETVYEQVETSGPRFSFEIPDDYSLSCDWFAIPTSEVGTDSSNDGDEGDDADTKTGTVTVVAYDCPKNTEERESFDEYQASCTATREGATFKLDGDRSGNPGEQATGADGSAAWSDRQADRYFLYEPGVAARHDAPAVFCDTYTALDGLVPNYALYDVTEEGRIQFDLAAGESITCSWFKIPSATALESAEDEDLTEDQSENQTEDGNGNETDSAQEVPSGTSSITVFEWRCPAGFDVAAQDANPWIECAVATDDVAFTIAGSGAQKSGNALPGGIRWDGLGEGSYQIDDTQADDAASGFVLACHGLTAPAAYPLYSTDSGAPLEIALGAGQQVACLWFTVPAAA